MTAPTPPWAQRRGGPPDPGSPLDEHFAAFVGPRWNRYRDKFRPFFDDPRFQPTWNWAAALTIPLGAAWFLYRKLYLPFLFFALVPSVVFGLLWGDGQLTQTVPNPLDPSGPPATTLVPDAALLMLGVLLSTAVLAGGTANYLLFRRAAAAMQLVAAHDSDVGTRLPLLRRLGGVSWASVAVGLGAIIVLQLLASVATPR